VIPLFLNHVVASSFSTAITDWKPIMSKYLTFPHLKLPNFITTGPLHKRTTIKSDNAFHFFTDQQSAITQPMNVHPRNAFKINIDVTFLCPSENATALGRKYRASKATTIISPMF
jgi:hypothetical protein